MPRPTRMQSDSRTGNLRKNKNITVNKGFAGEPAGIRTRDLLIKSQLLYQLSYRPTQGV